ncbi:MAG: ABC transporter substrate-binding protein [Defluviitaleaceae bacterium]|nr:ABC transporter substrate-binding protein [Defluviitaleaceae bacterium]
MKRFEKLLVLSLLIMALVLLVACNRGGETTDPVDEDPPEVEDIVQPEDDDDEVEEEDGGLAAYMEEHLGEIDPDHPLYNLLQLQARFPSVAGRNNTNEPIDGGHLRMGVGNDSPFVGIFNQVFLAAGMDDNFYAPVRGGSIFSQTPIRTMGQAGIATWTYDRDSRTITITQVEDVYWHDGHPLTLGDLVFAHEVIASPGFSAAGGIRWNTDQQNIVGAMEFHNGEADYISGLVLSEDERTLTIEFIDFHPALMYFGFWTEPYPRHIWEDIPIEEHSDHAMTRETPIGWGPFMVERIVPGEAVYLVANENFWLGRPYIDSMSIHIVATDIAPMAMLEGEFDIMGWRTQWFEYAPEPTNFMYIADASNSFTILTFNLGYFDPETSSIISWDPEEARMGDVRLRRAIGYAYNGLELSNTLFHGLRVPASSIIPPGHPGFLDPTLGGFADHNPERAMELLDEAGFLMGDDGWRTDPDGNEFIIRYAVGAGGTDAEIMANHFQQNLADVGLQVELMWMDFDAELLPNVLLGGYPRDNFDVTSFMWGAGANPNPNTFSGPNSNMNIPGFMNERMETVLAGFGSDQAWDSDWLIALYHEFQQLYYYYAPGIPQQWMISMIAVNNRVINLENPMYTPLREDGLRTSGGIHRVRLTAEHAYRQ